MKNNLVALVLPSALAFILWFAQVTGSAADPAADAIRVACVGDSITQGSGSDNPYPAQLQKLLGNGYDVKNFGVSGRTLLRKGDYPYWKEKAYTDAKDFQPNVVIIMLGTNDTKPQNWKFFNEFTQDYKDLVESFKNLDSKPTIYVCRPCPAFGIGNYGINQPNLDQEMPVIDTLAAEEGATVLDMHAALIDHPEVAGDRVHPNAAGDAIMAQVIAAALKTK